MTRIKINDTDHVARYCKSKTLNDDGTPSGPAFLPRSSDEYLSVNWMEYFKEPGHAECMSMIKKILNQKRFDARQSGRFAVIRVSDVRTAGRRAGRDLSVDLVPTLHDKSHAGIFNYDHTDLEIAEEIAHTVGKGDLYAPSN